MVNVDREERGDTLCAFSCPLSLSQSSVAFFIVHPYKVVSRACLVQFFGPAHLVIIGLGRLDHRNNLVSHVCVQRGILQIFSTSEVEFGDESNVCDDESIGGGVYFWRYLGVIARFAIAVVNENQKESGG